MSTKEQMIIVWEEVDGVDVERRVHYERRDAEPDNNIPYAYFEVDYVVDAYGRDIYLDGDDDKRSYFQEQVAMSLSIDPDDDGEDSY